MKNSCWQILLQGDAFQDWTDKEKMAIANLFNYHGSLEDIKINDVFPTSLKETDVAEFFSSPIPTSKYVDKRIRAIEFHNFRLFPSPPTKVKPYGIDFTKKGEPCSLFLVGGNGSGKSSVYSALEYHYTGICSHAEEMQCKISDYLTYGFGRLDDIKTEDVSLGIFRQDNKENDGKYKVFEQKLGNYHPICLSSAFCSDYDVEQIKKNGSALYLYILRQLGYEQFEQISNCIVKMIQNLEDMRKGIPTENLENLSSSDFNVVISNFFRTINVDDDNIEKECELYKKNDKIKKIIESDSDYQHKPTLFREQWEIVEKSYKASLFSSNSGMIMQATSTENAEYEKQVSSLSILYFEFMKILESKKKLKEDDKYKDKTNLLLELLDNMMKKKRELETNEYRQILETDNELKITEKISTLIKINTLINKTQHKILLQFQQTFQNEISEILESFSEYGETYFVEVSSNSFELKISVPTEKGTFSATPFEYFNSFRFKLFCITLKICLSIYWMKKNKTIVPFVIDDVFNANDFNNGLKLEQFVYTIYKWYDQKLMKADGCNIPLQLVMLTHDDLMLSAFKKGFMYMSETDLIDNHYCKKSLDNLRCGRLFPYRAIDHENENKQGIFKNLYIDSERFFC